MKRKTRKVFAKRVKVTGRKKLILRRANQNHFNAKDSGQQGQAKKKGKLLAKSSQKIAKKILPYL